MRLLRIHSLITLEFNFQLHPSCPGLGETGDSNVWVVSKEHLQLKKIKSIHSRIATEENESLGTCKTIYLQWS